jgi:hypothetical protein
VGNLFCARQMIAFIKGLPDIVERMVDKIESPAVQDMLLRIVACEEAGAAGTIQVRSPSSMVSKSLLRAAHSGRAFLFAVAAIRVPDPKTPRPFVAILHSIYPCHRGGRVEVDRGIVGVGSVQSQRW